MKLLEILRKTIILKNLSPEKAAGYIGCTGRQVRRWIKGESNPGQVHRKAIASAILKINNYKSCPLCGDSIKKEA